MTDVELAHIRNKSIGFVFQSFNLLTRLSVYENVEIPLIYSDVPVGERKKMIENAVHEVGLDRKALCGNGKAFRRAKAAHCDRPALENNPDIIFADEPTGNLDSVSGAQVMSILDGLNKNGHTIILVTHETATAEFADRIIRLRDGVIESDVPVKNPRNSKDQFVK